MLAAIARATRHGWVTTGRCCVRGWQLSRRSGMGRTINISYSGVVSLAPGWVFGPDDDFPF